MTTAQLLHAALTVDFLPRYRGMLAVLVYRALRYRTAETRAQLRERRAALHRAGRRLYRLTDRWAGLGVFPTLRPDAAEVPLLQAAVESAAARRDGDAARLRYWRHQLERAALAFGTEVTR